MQPFYGSTFVISAGIATLVAAVAWHRRAAPGALGLAVASAAMGCWSFIYSAVWVYTDHGPSLGWLAARNVALWIALYGVYAMAADYAGRRELLTRGVLVGLAALLTLNVAALLTDPLHGLYLAGNEPGLVVMQGGPLYVAQGVVLYALMAMAVGLLIGSIIRSRGRQRRHAIVLSVAIAIPAIVMGLEQARVSLMPGVNAVPVMWGVAGLVLIVELYRGDLFQFAPLPRDRVIEEMPEGMLVFDRHGRLTDVNPAATRLVPCDERAVGSSVAAVLADWGSRAAPVIDLVATGSGRTEVTLSDEPPFVVEVAVTTVADEVGARAATIMILRDITERARNERQQREFVANASHEMQTPLAGLALLSSMLKEAARDDPEQLQIFLGRLSTETDRLVTMTRSLLELSRLDEGPLPQATARERIDLATVLAEEVDAVSVVARDKGQQLHAEPASGCWVNGDASELAVAVGNLLENAVRYTPEGGHIRARISVDDERLHGPWVVLSIADDGIGIAPEDAERVFERFYRVDRARARATGGSGLGLSIVRSIVKRHHGEVTLESEPGRGSTFTMRLPAAR